ncbi:MAG: hypothetical protein JWR77_1311 [Rhizorhabdus sp.]|nr:hypothetical protein [Rhizorhabdus sp.]
MMSFKAAALGLITFVSATVADAAYIETNHEFIVNGGFEKTTNGVGELGYNTNATGWTSAPDGDGNYGYNFIFSPSTASTTGVRNEYKEDLKLWGPGNGANNGLKASPTGGNFLGADGAYHTGYVYQFVSDLIVGHKYTLSFDTAAAQQYGYDGKTTESWYYGLASQGLSGQTATVNNANHGFVDWQHQVFTFTASKTSDYVYFLAEGAPEGQPPFSLLDSVSLTGDYSVSAAPEPGTWAMLVLGFGLIGFMTRRRRRPIAAFA